MAVDWRSTLQTLLSQFESRASQSPGLHHLFVEAADHERDKTMGPTWFAPFSHSVRIIEGRPHYEPWDCCASRGLPWVNPGFREPESDETFGESDSDRVIRDGSGVVRAVAVPMKLRTGYFCGKPSESVSGFESLANAAAIALAGSNSLDEHAFASELTDIFRGPRAGVRYVFGEIPGAPNHFIAKGWSAGVLQFENGVLIDLPISETTPDASHWLLLLHRLGWRHIDGTGLRAERRAWAGNVEITLDSFDQDWSGYPEGFSKHIANVSRDSFYSVLGTKEAPLDVNLASVFAIQVLLTDLSSSTAGSAIKTDFEKSKESRPLDEPQLRTVRYEEVKVQCAQVGVLVATEVERQAVLRRMRPIGDNEEVLQVHEGSNTYFVGRFGATDIVLCMTAMGSSGRDASGMVTAEMLQTWDLRSIIMVGIAFGKDATKQAIGNVLVSDRIISYEPERIGSGSSQDRGTEPSAGPVLLNRFRNVVGWKFTAPSGGHCGFQVGPILSGEKLVDNPEFKRRLFERFPTAIGGEMEGAGVAAAAERKRCEWIVVKAICDWGDGEKTSQCQEFAAASAVDLVEHVLNQPGALDALAPDEGSRNSD